MARPKKKKTGKYLTGYGEGAQATPGYRTGGGQQNIGSPFDLATTAAAQNPHPWQPQLPNIAAPQPEAVGPQYTTNPHVFRQGLEGVEPSALRQPFGVKMIGSHHVTPEFMQEFRQPGSMQQSPGPGSQPPAATPQQPTLAQQPAPVAPASVAPPAAFGGIQPVAQQAGQAATAFGGIASNVAQQAGQFGQGLANQVAPIAQQFGQGAKALVNQAANVFGSPVAGTRAPVASETQFQAQQAPANRFLVPPAAGSGGMMGAMLSPYLANALPQATAQLPQPNASLPSRPFLPTPSTPLTGDEARATIGGGLSVPTQWQPGQPFPLQLMDMPAGGAPPSPPLDIQPDVAAMARQGAAPGASPLAPAPTTQPQMAPAFQPTSGAGIPIANLNAPQQVTPGQLIAEHPEAAAGKGYFGEGDTWAPEMQQAANRRHLSQAGTPFAERHQNRLDRANPFRAQQRMMEGMAGGGQRAPSPMQLIAMGMQPDEAAHISQAITERQRLDQEAEAQTNPLVLANTYLQRWDARKIEDPTWVPTVGEWNDYRRAQEVIGQGLGAPQPPNGPAGGVNQPTDRDKILQAAENMGPQEYARVAAMDNRELRKWANQHGMRDEGFGIPVEPTFWGSFGQFLGDLIPPPKQMGVHKEWKGPLPKNT